jgi:transcriptional regulator with XRE-family HTH domain
MNTGEQKPSQSVEVLFGKVVRRHREALGFSQEKLADECDLHRTYISQVERGLKSPSLRSLILIAAALKSRASALMREVEQAQDEAAQ